MSNISYSSKLLENAVGEFAKLPGVGNKTALRLVLHLLKLDTETVNQFGNSLVCVVETIRDVMSIENTLQFHGVYHVLGGIISPMEGVGPADLTISALEEKVSQGLVKEVILALSTTLEGDTTNFYIFKKLKKYDLTITTLARGVSFGDELEYTDEITLGRSLVNRTPFETTLH